MSLVDNMKTLGRVITKNIKYYISGTEYTLSADDFVSAKYGFNTQFGDGTACAFLELETKNNLNLLPGDQVLMTFSVNANSSTYTKQLGFGSKFYLKEVPGIDLNSKTYKYKLYDEMLLSMIPYEPINVVYPISVQSYFETIVNALGWSTSITLDITGAMQLNEDIYADLDYTYRDILSDIFQANGMLGYISTGHTLYSKSITNSEASTTIDDDILKNTNVSLGKMYGPINSLTLTRADGTDSISETDSASITGYGLTNITYNNILLSGEDRSTYITPLFNKIKGKKWYLYDTETTGYGNFSLWQRINISTNGSTYNSYVFNNEITFTDGYDEVIYNTNDDQQVGTEYVATSRDIKNDNNATITINKKIGEVDIRGKTINLTADNIQIASTNFNVDNAGNLTCNSATMTNGTITGGTLSVSDIGTPNSGKIIITDENNSGTNTLYSGGFSINDKQYINDGVLNSISTYSQLVVGSRGFSNLVFTNRDSGGTPLQTYETQINANYVQVKDSYNNNGAFSQMNATEMYVSDNNGNYVELKSNAINVNNRNILQNKLLKAPGWTMNATQTVNLDENVSDQPHGIILVWSAYRNSAVQDYSWHCFYIPKYLVAQKPGNGYTFILADSKFGMIGTKYVYISNSTITGNADNTASGTSSATNIKYNNGGWVLRYVIGI